MPNHGPNCKDIICKNILIKNKKVIDKNCNVHARNVHARCVYTPKILSRNIKVQGTLCVGEMKPLKSIDLALEKLYEGFLLVDEGFNDPDKLGLTPVELAQIGFYDDKSTVFAHGPFTPGSPIVHPGQHANHTNQPGVQQETGALNCSALQAAFEGGFLLDTNFGGPHTAPAPTAPRIYHEFPISNGYLGNDHFIVGSRALVTYGTNAPPPTGTTVVDVTAWAIYRLECDENGDTKIPVVVKIDFAMKYVD